MTSRPWRIKTIRKLITTWTSFEVSNSSDSFGAITHSGFWRTMLAPPRSDIFFGLDFLWGLGIVKKKKDRDDESLEAPKNEQGKEVDDG